MSGGSLNYLYSRVEDAADRIREFWNTTTHERERAPQGLAFAALLTLVAEALRETEWHISSDGTNWATMDKLISPRDEATQVAASLASLIDLAETVLAKLRGTQ